ncbi:MAG: outer membrane beta-barrel protein [Chitinophagales bacterium]|jgi:hypothetical protein|nr:outer membrane beta-barrel protein [Bacteroidota bacterium]MBP8917763.1 outer membrane beta-barrel protein [Chitinophagales bacterium]MBP9221974.1 outer membrane beta-barrel protein [Chitinophagales bacterium]MBP9795637.1 outer membrane beta-barrel protein [Chitinophagales bacterium]
MKKTLTLLLCVVSIAASAQEFRYGFYLSPTKNTFVPEGDLYTPYGENGGFQYGILLEQTFGKGEHIGLGAGITMDYFQSGLESLEAGQNKDTKNWDVRPRYIEIPVAVKLRTGQLGKLTPYLQGGITYASAIRARGDYTLNGQVHDSDLDYINKENQNGLIYLPKNLSIDLGIGTEFEIKDGASVFLAFYFKNGIMNVWEDNTDKDDIFTRQFGVSIGGLF